MTALHRAVTLPHINRILAVSKDLNFHVARVFQIALQVDFGVVEEALRFRAGQCHGVGQGCFGIHHAHPASATTAGRLDDHRITDTLGDTQDFLRVVRQGAVRTGHAGHPGSLHRRLGRDLVAHQTDGFRARPDENETGGFHPLGKIGIFREEAVAGVNRLGIGDFRCRNDRRDVEITQLRRGRADAHRFVGQADVLGLAVGVGMHHHGLDTQFAAGALDAQGNFATIGDQNLTEHAEPPSSR